MTWYKCVIFISCQQFLFRNTKTRSSSLITQLMQCWHRHRVNGHIGISPHLLRKLSLVKAIRQPHWESGSIFRRMILLFSTYHFAWYISPYTMTEIVDACYIDCHRAHTCLDLITSLESQSWSKSETSVKANCLLSTAVSTDSRIFFSKEFLSAKKPN